MKVPVQYRVAGGSAREIAASLEGGMRDGRLEAGARLPTVRALAGSLRVSPATVASAYRELRARGLLRAEGRRGTRVVHRPPIRTRATTPVPRGLRDLSDGNPDPALLPRLRGALARIDDGPGLYGETAFLPDLRAIAARDFDADGIPSGSLAIVGGAMDGVERVLQAHLRPGDRVAVEDPGYPGVHDVVAGLGLRAVPLEIDESGPSPESLARALETGVSAVVLTPRAQNPLGAALSEPRARELSRTLDARPEVLVVEDDHAGPVAGAPAATTVGRKRDRWAVVRSVSKWLGPDLRVAFLAGDETTVARVEGRQSIGPGWVSRLLQRAVLGLWSAGDARARLRAAAAAYSKRRSVLIEALRRRGIRALGRSGLNVWVPVPEEARIVTVLAAAGWVVRAGERYRLKSEPAIRITVASLRADESDRLADAVAGSFDRGALTHTA